MAVMLVPLLLLLLLLSSSYDPAEAIRLLKEGPMIDSEGREYKSVASRLNEESFSEPQQGSRVHVECTHASVMVFPKADLLQNGFLVSPSELLLGGVNRPECRAAAAGHGEYIIEAGLRDCDSRLTISEDAVLYSNKLIFSPAVNHRGIRRRTRVVIPVFCQYRFGTHEQQQQPPPAPQKHSAFSLQLMTNDWTAETSSTVFYLGDMLHLQASHMGGGGAGRVFINSCVATLTPDVTSVPRYYFIQNYGCLVDSKEQGSNAAFRPRTRADVLQLQLDAFLFHQDPRNSIFITCQLTVSSEMHRSSQTNKACSYQHSRWENVDESNHVCHCCESTCDESSLETSNMAVIGGRTPAGTPDTPSHRTCDTLTLGPLRILPKK